VLLHSDRKTDGCLLEAFLECDPKSTLIVKLAKGLLAHRKKGRWNNTQENCFILMALDKYFHVYEKEEPEFVAKMWLGDDFAGSQEFIGRSTNTNQLTIPMDWLASKGTQPFILEKTGRGRLYYRLGLEYAPKSLSMAAASYGFMVSRTYEGVDDRKHVSVGPDGTWKFALGEKVRVRVKLATVSRRYHVALVDKLPAGLEILNPALKGTPEAPIKSGGLAVEKSSPFSYHYVDPMFWYEHQNLRDERAEAFQSLLWQGVYEYQYICRATTAGKFVIPPAKAEEMYSPEIFGRSATDKAIIE